jgi:hypothetical protein
MKFMLDSIFLQQAMNTGAAGRGVALGSRGWRAGTGGRFDPPVGPHLGQPSRQSLSQHLDRTPAAQAMIQRRDDGPGAACQQGEAGQLLAGVIEELLRGDLLQFLLRGAGDVRLDQLGDVVEHQAEGGLEDRGFGGGADEVFEREDFGDFLKDLLDAPTPQISGQELLGGIGLLIEQIGDDRDRFLRRDARG